MFDKKKVEWLTKLHDPLVVYWLPWRWRFTDTAKVRRQVARHTWHSRKGVMRKLAGIIRTLLWPLLGGLALMVAWLDHSGHALLLSGRSRGKQFWELLVFTYWYGFTPSEYYERKLHDEDIYSTLSYFISEYDTKALAVSLNGPMTASVKSKHLFDAVCKKENLPIVPTFAYLEPGKNEVILNAESMPLPQQDLFFKPEYGMEGVGIERWDYDGSANVWSFKEVSYDAEKLRTHFHTLSSKGPYLLQVAQSNHPDIAAFSPGGLITFRLVSVSDGISEPSVIGSHISMPRHLTTTNHESNGGIEAEVNLETHCFKPGYSFMPYPEQHSWHPTTDIQIEGNHCKIWPTLEALAIKLHSNFPDVLSIGWDIAYTPDGPVVLEGNTWWGLHNGMFLGKTAYVPTCLNVMRKRSDRL